MRKLIFVFILIFFCSTFASWVHFFPEVIYGRCTGRYGEPMITKVGDDIAIVFRKIGGFPEIYAKLVRLDKDGRITGDVWLGYAGPDTTIDIKPIGLNRGLGSYLELYYGSYYSRRKKLNILYLDSSLTVIDELHLDYIYEYMYEYYRRDICRADSSYIVLSGDKKIGRIARDGDTIWHIDDLDTVHFTPIKLAPSKDGRFVFVAGMEHYRSSIISVKKLDISSGSVLWGTSGFAIESGKIFRLVSTYEGGVIAFYKNPRFHRYAYYWDSLGNTRLIKPERDFVDFKLSNLTPIDTNLYWACGMWAPGNLAAIAKVKLESDTIIKFLFFRTYPLHGYVDRIIPIPDSIIIAGSADTSLGEFANFYFVIKADTLGNAGIVEGHSFLPSNLNLIVYPNPFNSSCIITYPYEGEWNVKIFNTAGRLVYESGKMSGKSFIWQPRDNMESGLYIVVASDGKINLARKVFYIK